VINELVNELTDKVEDVLVDTEASYRLHYQIRAAIEEVLVKHLKVLQANYYFNNEIANIESFEAYAKSKLAVTMAQHLTEVMQFEDVPERDYHATKKATLVVLDMKEKK